MISWATSTAVLPDSWRKGELRALPLAVVAASWAGLYSALQYGGSVAHSLLTANATALVIWLLVTLVRLTLRGRLPAWVLVLVIPASTFIGSRLASLAGAPDYVMQLVQHRGTMGRVILCNIMIGITITAFFLYFSYSTGVRRDLERERRRAAEAAQAETAARLALLQAQIEPHFLFNNLANIHSLIKEDPDTASLLLEELNAYLRTSLRRSRAMTGSVGDELELIEALLGIAAARLRARLDYTICAPAEVRAMFFPPLLLQPLVENAIRHGIEPAIGGGTISVDVRWQDSDSVLECTVRDSGIGLKADAPQGVGLSNVRSRLASLFGERGRLEFYTNAPTGVIAKLIVPVASPLIVP
jgi:sensor histidine kinase YesM